MPADDHRLGAPVSDIDATPPSKRRRKREGCMKDDPKEPEDSASKAGKIIGNVFAALVYLGVIALMINVVVG
jgi:hypothetical protein